MLKWAYMHRTLGKQMDRFINIFKSLSDKTRIRILHILLRVEKELCICEIMDTLQMAQYNVSKHMKELKIAGLVKERKEGRFVFYSLVQQKDKFYKYIIRTINSIPEEYFSQDNKLFKKRILLKRKCK